MDSAVEKQLQRLAGMETDVPEPQSRVEKLLQQIYENGGTGGGGGDKSYTHTQATPSKIWSIHHQLGVKYPFVLCVDSNGDEAVGNVTYISKDDTKITFSEEVSGIARLK